MPVQRGHRSPLATVRPLASLFQGERVLFDPDLVTQRDSRGRRGLSQGEWVLFDPDLFTERDQRGCRGRLGVRTVTTRGRDRTRAASPPLWHARDR